MPIDKTPWTEDTRMPWGPYAGAKLKDIPAEWFLEIASKPWLRDWPGLYHYVEQHKAAWLAEMPEEKKSSGGAMSSYQDYLDER